MFFTILPLEKLASVQFAKSFWNVPFNSEELNNIEYIIERKWEVKLVNHRENTIRASSDFIEKSKLCSLFKVILKESIFSLFQAYRQMVLWKIKHDPLRRIDLLKEGELYAPNYFTADGEFKDFAWAKQFIISSESLIARFYLACNYWFENETLNLWSEIKGDSSRYESNLDVIREYEQPLVVLRIFQMENQLQTLAEDWRYVGDFWEVGFKFAAEKGYERATYYFWPKIFEPEKINITENDEFFHLISSTIDDPNDKVSYFLYSQLSKARKEDLCDWIIEHNKPSKLLALLLSPYTEVIRSEVIEFVFQLPIELYSHLLQSLANRIKQLKHPFDVKMFQVMWSDLSATEKIQVLEERSYLIKTLIEAKSFYNLSYIIEGLSPEQKEKCLLNGWYGAGISSLDILCREDEFDLLQHYIFFFLTETNPFTKNSTIRKDASSFLQKFIESPSFNRWCKKDLSRAKEQEVKDRIDILQTSLSLLEDLCDKVCERVNKPQASIITSLVKNDLNINEVKKLTSSSLKRKCEVEDKSAKQMITKI